MGSGARLGRAASHDSDVARARSSSGALSVSGMPEYAQSPHKGGPPLGRQLSGSLAPRGAPAPVRTRSAKDGRRAGSRHGQARSPGGVGSVASATPRTDVTANSMDPNCRICMESVTLRDFEARRAMRLGCKCSSGLEIVHFPCAKRWFRIRRSVACEICEAEARNLPEGLKNEIRELAAAAETARREEARERMRSLAQARIDALSRSDEVHLCTYTTFCLLPAAIAAIALVFFFYG
ncbi:unnamed protein product [Ostreobium quekettii]|uniref:RING-CH-type domain-containing protein n=1 Tax=Ostreobium quekettii TaxID=121088 RepID=A0A8S1J9Z2_9CHLO|nr:unnamed protein product [Ostreobium quekettii]|eukprot:evm.model.scf_814.3 EVM.evm.TU.scf_814.3   scf_814:10840-14034(+)